MQFRLCPDISPSYDIPPSSSSGDGLESEEALSLPEDMSSLSDVVLPLFEGVSPSSEDVPPLFEDESLSEDESLLDDASLSACVLLLSESVAGLSAGWLVAAAVFWLITSRL